MNTWPSDHDPSHRSDPVLSVHIGSPAWTDPVLSADNGRSGLCSDHVAPVTQQLTHYYMWEFADNAYLQRHEADVANERLRQLSSRFETAADTQGLRGSYGNQYTLQIPSNVC